MNERLFALLNEFEQEQTSNRTSNRDSRVMIIDGMNIFIGAFSASPAMNHLGEHIGGLKGFLSSLFSVVARFKPTRCIIAFDGLESSTLRRKKYSDYKSGRKNRFRLNRFVEILDERESCQQQLVKLSSYLSVLPVTTITVDYAEADDVIGYIVSQYYSGDDSEVIIVSSDKDYLQLIRPNVRVYRFMQKQMYDESTVVSSFGIPAYNFLTFRAVTGDASDSLPGVKGMGLKTLVKLIPEMKEQPMTCDDVLRISQERIDSGSKLRGYKNIINEREQIMLNLELMQLHDVDLPGAKKLNINAHLENPIDKYDIMQFRKLLYADGLNTDLSFLDSKATLSMSELNYYAEGET